jgi:SM-20-related protein
MLTETQLNHFQEHGFILIDEFLPADTTLQISHHIEHLHAQQQLKQARIGKAATEHVNTSERGDLIHWIQPDQSPAFIQTFLESIDALRQSLNRHFYLGLRAFESHMTSYPSGTYYKRHVDRHQSGSSRRVSVVFYLNPNWEIAHGGHLHLYIADQDHAIAPLFGRLALFLSEIEHEVALTHVPRKSITGWLLTEEII